MDCLLHMMHLISCTFQKKHHTLILFVNLKVVFDSASHLGIQYKLLKTGITGAHLSWRHDFLTFHSFQVLMGSNKSSWWSIDREEPQGSVLSTVLFSNLLNDKPSPHQLMYLCMLMTSRALCVLLLQLCQVSELCKRLLWKYTFLLEWGLC